MYVNYGGFGALTGCCCCCCEEWAAEVEASDDDPGAEGSFLVNIGITVTWTRSHRLGNMARMPLNEFVSGLFVAHG